MEVLGKRIRAVWEEDMMSVEGAKMAGLESSKKKMKKNLMRLEKSCVTGEKRMKKKRSKLEKARELVAKLERETSEDKKKLEKDFEEKRKLCSVMEDIDLEIEDFERRLFVKATPIVEAAAEDLGIHVERNSECGVCMVDWPFVVNTCVSESCKYVVCVKCYEKCNDKCPNCRLEFKK